MTTNIWPADPNASLAGVLAADAYNTSPVVVNVMSGVLTAGKVQNTSFVPVLKLTAVPPSEDVITVVLVKFADVASNVPRPTSHSLVP